MDGHARYVRPAEPRGAFDVRLRRRRLFSRGRLSGDQSGPRGAAGPRRLTRPAASCGGRPAPTRPHLHRYGTVSGTATPSSIAPSSVSVSAGTVGSAGEVASSSAAGSWSVIRLSIPYSTPAYSGLDRERPVMTLSLWVRMSSAAVARSGGS